MQNWLQKTPTVSTHSSRRETTREDNVYLLSTIKMKAYAPSEEGGRSSRYVTPDLSYEPKGAGEGGQT